MKRRKSRLDLTLCPRCAADFRSDNRIVRRIDPHNNVKTRCDICQVRFGYDYLVEDRQEAVQ